MKWREEKQSKRVGKSTRCGVIVLALQVNPRVKSESRKVDYKVRSHRVDYKVRSHRVSYY